jgi:copper chaperone CopZ
MASKLNAVCPDIACDACAASIIKSLTRADGVADVTVDVEAQKVTILYDEARLTPAMISARLELAGFKPTELT